MKKVNFSCSALPRSSAQAPHPSKEKKQKKKRKSKKQGSKITIYYETGKLYTLHALPRQLHQPLPTNPANLIHAHPNHHSETQLPKAISNPHPTQSKSTKQATPTQHPSTLSCQYTTYKLKAEEGGASPQAHLTRSRAAPNFT